MTLVHSEESCETPGSEVFNSRVTTSVCKELPAPDNPYLAERLLVHGYDVGELLHRRDYVDVVFLTLQGELPSAEQKQLFELVLIALSHPGPRHPATRSVMTAGGSNTNAAQLLPIGLSLMGGAHLGASTVTAAMEFLSDHRAHDPVAVARQLQLPRDLSEEKTSQGIPGFGEHFGSRDRRSEALVQTLLDRCCSCDMVRWGQAMVEAVPEAIPFGWLSTGVAAAAFVDLGFSPAMGGGVYQAASWPGLLAHGLEALARPLTAQPFVSDEHFHYQGDTHE